MEQTNKDMEIVQEKIAMLVKTNRIDNLIDILAVVSDNVEMMNDDMVEKVIKRVDGATSAAFMTENSMKYAKQRIDNGETYNSIFQVLKAFKDPEVSKGLSFTLHMLKGLGKQL